MGRARNHQRQAVASGNFNTVLGVHRGSAASQAQRDAREQYDRELSLQEFQNQVRERTHSNRWIAVLARAQQSLADGGLTKALWEGEELVEKLIANMSYEGAGFDEGSLQLARMAALGDPWGWEGLTVPVVTAMSSYFQDAAAFADVNELGDVVATSTPQQTGCAYQVLQQCFSQREDISYYQRLQPLCEAFGAFMASFGGKVTTKLTLEEKISHNNDAAEEGIGLLAIKVLAAAPTAALTGPLRSWVEAFEIRCDSNDLSDIERSELQEMIKEVVLGTTSPLLDPKNLPPVDEERAEVFFGLSERFYERWYKKMEANDWEQWS
jgi:hypothetical protein